MMYGPLGRKLPLEASDASPGARPPASVRSKPGALRFVQLKAAGKGPGITREPRKLSAGPALPPGGGGSRRGPDGLRQIARPVPAGSGEALTLRVRVRGLR